MNPNPLYMLMKNMTQRAHGPRPYDGILGAQQEKVVAYEGDGEGKLESAITEATSWMLSSGTYAGGDRGILIEIRVVAEFDHLGDHNIHITEVTPDNSAVQSGCSCTSGRRCEPCLHA